VIPAGTRGHRSPPRRFRELPWTTALGNRVPVAERPLARLLGLALLDRKRAGPGLLIPRCRSIHTFGMCFPLDVTFLDRDGAVLARRRAVPPGRVLVQRRAAAVLEVAASAASADGRSALSPRA
jgi:uncharacterized membrane protein (UPF0127 family)